MPHKRVPEPWKSFLADIDGNLEQDVILHCIGGFAIAMLYDLPRPTVDVDCLIVIPVERSLRQHCATCRVAEESFRLGESALDAARPR